MTDKVLVGAPRAKILGELDGWSEAVLDYIVATETPAVSLG